jgi:putative phosphoesterase
MKKIGIISDTHGSLDNKVLKIFSDVDLIIHAGDIGKLDVIQELSSIAETISVYGNMDDFDLRTMAKKHINLELEGFKIHISHNENIKGSDFDIVINGHTHMATLYHDGKTLFLNPGSANAKRAIPYEKPSVILLDLDNGKVAASNIIFI